MIRLITLILFSLLMSDCYSASTALNIAVEAKSIRVEYIESSKRGVIYVYSCNQCKQRQYYFDKAPTILRSGKSISFRTFLKDYWNAKIPTLVLDPYSKTVLKVVY